MKEKLHFCGLSAAINGTLKSSGSSRIGGFIMVFLFLFINVESWGQNVGDYRSVGNGNWTSASSWQVYNGTTWVGATYYPGQTTNPQQYYGEVTIQDNHTITIGQNNVTLSVPIQKITIKGTLFLDGKTNDQSYFSFNTLSIYVDQTTGGQIYFDNKVQLILPANAVIEVVSDPPNNYYGLVGDCNHLQQIKIGEIVIAFCNGAPGTYIYTFRELMELGGSLNAIITTSEILCGTVFTKISGSYTGVPPSTPVTITWRIIKPNGQDLNPAPTGLNFNLNLTDDGDYTIIFTVSFIFKGAIISNTETIIIHNKPLNFVNLQTLGNGTICLGDSISTSGQVYEPGLTDGAGQGAGITAQFGYSMTDTDPSTWTNWINATYNPLITGNNDEYTYTFTPPVDGTYYYAYRYTYGDCVHYGGYSASGGGTWNGTTNVSGEVVVLPTGVHTLTLTAGTVPALLCENSTLIPNIVYTVGGGAIGANVAGLPTGMNGTYVFNNLTSIGTFTISGTPTVGGNYTYTITTIGSYCSPDVITLTGQINVTSPLDWFNLQFPGSGTICQGGTYDVYGQVYESGVTEGTGQGSYIIAEFGYSLTNTDPVTWINWATANYNSDIGNNDEYKYTFTPPSAGTFYYTFRYRQGPCAWQYGGFVGGIWDGSANISGILTVNSNAPHTIAITSSSPNAALCENTLLPANITYSIASGATGATVTGLPSGMVGSYNTGVFTISGTPTQSGLFNYTVSTTGNGCAPAVTATGTITVSSTLDWANLQHPGTAEICQGSTFVAYGQVYESGVTPGLNSQGAGITAEFGYSTTNTNPNTWTNWFPTSFNGVGDAGGLNNDEYMITFGSALLPGTYYYTFRYKQGTCDWQYGGYVLNAGGFWGGSNVNGVLTVLSKPTAVISSNNGPNVCANTNVTFTLTGTPGAIVTYNINGGDNATVTLTGGSATITIPNVNANQTLNLVSIADTKCSQNLIGLSTVSVGASTIWNGSSWSNGTPTNGLTAVINGNYTLTSNMYACSMTINSGYTFTIASGYTLTLLNDLVNNGILSINNKGSLVQINDIANTGTGKTEVQKITGTYPNYDYFYWSSPVDGETFGSAFGNVNPYMFKHNAANYLDLFSGSYTQNLPNADGFDDNGDEWEWVSFGETIAKGKGYAVMGSGSPMPFNPTLIPNSQPGLTVLFDGGRANNGNIDVAVFKDYYNQNNYGTSGSYTDQSYKDANTNANLIGNPYPSSIDIFELKKDNSKLTGTFYFWTHNLGMTNPNGPSAYDLWNSDYATITTDGNAIISTVASSGGVTPSRYISSCQGFMANVNDNGTVTFNNSMRVAGNNDTFHRQSKSEEIDRIWLNLTNEGGMFYQLLVGFHSTTSENFVEGEDGPRMFKRNSPDFYSTLKDYSRRLAIQMLADFNDLKTVPIGMEITQEGSYKIGIDHTEGIFKLDQKVYLQDLYNNVIHDFSKGAYTFYTVAGENINDRFVLRFTNDNAALGIGENSLEDLKIYPNPSKGLFNITYFDTEPLTVEIYDLSGKQLKKTTGKNQVDISGYAKGIYFAKIQTETHSVTKKLVVE